MNKPEVLVEPRGLCVVVTRADVNVPPDVAFLLTHDETQLAVRLQTDQSVHDVASRALQGPCPFDVRLFVEARLDLNEYHDLLAGLRGLSESLDDCALTGGAVERLLDRQDVRIGRSLFDESLDARVEGLVWMLNEDVLLAGAP